MKSLSKQFLGVSLVCIALLYTVTAQAGMVPKSKAVQQESSAAQQQVQAPSQQVMTGSQAAERLKADASLLQQDLVQRDILASKSTVGSAPTLGSSSPVISGDGKHILFKSKATDLSSTDTPPGSYRLYAYNVETDSVMLMAPTGAGNAGYTYIDGISVGGPNSVNGISFCSSFTSSDRNDDKPDVVMVSDTSGNVNTIDSFNMIRFSMGDTAISPNCDSIAYIVRDNQQWEKILAMPLGWSTGVPTPGTPITASTCDGGVEYGLSANLEGPYAGGIRSTSYLLPHEYCIEASSDKENDPVCQGDYWQEPNISMSDAIQSILFPAVDSQGALQLMVTSYTSPQDAIVVNIPGAFIDITVESIKHNAISGDGKRIAFVAKNSAKEDKVYRCDLEIAGSTATCSNVIEVGDGEEFSMSYTGNRIAFANAPSEHIAVVDVKEGNVARVDTVQGKSPSISKDGTSLAFIRKHSDTGAWQVYYRNLGTNTKARQKN